MIKRNDAYYYKGLLLILALYIQFLFYVNFRESTIFYGCYISLFSLPDPVRDREDNRNVFSEERAWKHLEYFDSTGYNILGTYENEVLVPNYILKELEKLKNNKFNWIVEIDVFIYVIFAILLFYVCIYIYRLKKSLDLITQIS